MWDYAPCTVDLAVDLGTGLRWSGSGAYMGPVYTTKKQHFVFGFQDGETFY